MSENTRFWDRAAAKYAAAPVRDEAAYEKTLARTRHHLNGCANVLEFGCGTGTTALKLADCVGNLLASDVSPEMISIARAKLEKPEAPSNVRFAVAGVASGAFPERPFDAVLAFNLFHLLENPAEAASRVHSLLKPGGLFISKTICLGDANPLFRPLIWGMRAVGKAPLVQFFKTPALERLIADAGFEILETGNYPAKPPSRFIVAQRQ